MARPIAPRFEIRVLKDKSVSDNAQVPATDAVINFCRAGATVSATVVVPASATSAPVSVFDVGQVIVGDTVRIGAGPGTLTVSGLATNQVRVANPTSSPITLTSGTRLVPTNGRPNVYMDPLCSVSLGNLLYPDSAGQAAAYLPNNRMDYDVAIPNQPLRLYVDGTGMLGRSDRAWNDLRDFGGNLQAAIDALPPGGGTVFVPRGTWLMTSGATVNTPSVTIMGEQACSVLRAATANAFDLVTVNATNFQMRDLALDGAATSQDLSGRSCLYIRGLGTSGHLILDVLLQNVTLTGAPGHGLNMEDVIIIIAEGCHFDGNKGGGVRIDNGTQNPQGSTTTQFLSCTFSQNGERGCVVNNVTVLTFRGCSLKGNQGGATAQGNAIDALGCNRIDILSSHFGPAGTATAPDQFILVTGSGSAVVDACLFDGGADPAKQPAQAIHLAVGPSSRICSCAGMGLRSFLAFLDPQSLECVEMGNVELDQAVVRIKCDAPSETQRLTSMSRWSLGVPFLNSDADLPAGSDSVVPGAFAWVRLDDNLKVWDGFGWRFVSLS